MSEIIPFYKNTTHYTFFTFYVEDTFYVLVISLQDHTVFFGFPLFEDDDEFKVSYCDSELSNFLMDTVYPIFSVNIEKDKEVKNYILSHYFNFEEHMYALYYELDSALSRFEPEHYYIIQTDLSELSFIEDDVKIYRMTRWLYEKYPEL